MGGRPERLSGDAYRRVCLRADLMFPPGGEGRLRRGESMDFHVGQEIELQGWRLKVVGISQMQGYTLVYVVPRERLVPAVSYIRVDELGLHWRVPVGWKRSREEG